MSNEQQQQQQQQQQIRGALVAVMVSEPGRRHKSTGFRFMNSVVRQMSIALALRVASRVAVFISELDGPGPAGPYVCVAKSRFPEADRGVVCVTLQCTTMNRCAQQTRMERN